MQAIDSATVLKICGDIWHSTQAGIFDFVNSGKPASSLSGFQFDLSWVNNKPPPGVIDFLRNSDVVFPVVVGGLITLLMLLLAGCAVHFVVGQLLSCIAEILSTILSILFVETCNFLSCEFCHVGRLLKLLMKLVFIILLIVVALHLIFMIWAVHLYTKLRPDWVVEIWTGFTILYPLVIRRVIRCWESKSLRSFAKMVLDAIFPELVQYTLKTPQAQPQ